MSVKLETLPLFSTTAKIIKFFAYLIDNHWRCYVILTVTVPLNICKFLYVILSNNDLTNLVLTLFLCVLWLSSNMRAITLIRNKKEMNKFLEEIYSMYMGIMENGEKTTKDMLRETTKSARGICNFNLLLGFVSCIGMFFSAILAKKREFIFNMYLPFYDDKKLETPYYEILFTSQIFLLPVGCCMFIAFGNLLISLILFIIFMCQELQRKLKQTKGTETITVLNQELIKCINFHNIIAEYVSRINNWTTYLFSTEFIVFGTLVCVLLFLLLIVRTIYERVILSAYIIMIIVQLSLLYFFANRLYFESMAVADAAYDTNWYEYNGKSRLALKLIIQRAHKPICLTMGDFLPMTLEVLKTLLNVAYSYFTILRNMME